MVQERDFKSPESVEELMALVPHAKNIVRSAMIAVFSIGSTYDSFARALSTQVITSDRSRLYRLVVEKYAKQLIVYKHMGELETGLSIRGISLESPDGRGATEYSTIELPRDPKLVTVENIRHLHGIAPESLKRLAEDLQGGSLIGIERYLKAQTEVFKTPATSH